MDTSTFIVSMTEALAWPTAATFILLKFRTEISSLLERIKKGKIPGGEFEFSEAATRSIESNPSLAQKSSGSRSGSRAQDPDDSGPAWDLDSAYALLDVSNRAAVIEGWRQIEWAASEALSENFESGSGSGSDSGSDYCSPRRMPPARMGVLLKESQLLSGSQIALYDELRELRNRAMHHPEFEIEPKKAHDYLILAELLMEALDNDHGS